MATITSKSCALDASALIAYLKGEKGADEVEKLLEDGVTSCYAHAVNMCEVYYYFAKEADERTAGRAILSLRRAGVCVRRDIGERFWRAVGHYKAATQDVALADCFCVALAERLRCEVVTADHGDFQDLHNRGVCKVRFIR